MTLSPNNAAVSHSVRTDLPLVEVRNLKKYYPISGGIFGRTVAQVKAADGVSFKIRRGQTVGLVGESGCGKTTTGKVILRLEEPTDGKVFFEGTDIFSLRPEKLRQLRREMQIVFQDPYSSLDPRRTVESIVGEPLVVHGVARGKERRERVHELLSVVGLSAEQGRRYPHEFSGGQRQRIGIARALAMHPKFIVCDEPVSALDVSIQSQVLNLLRDLQDRFGLTYLFIAHDLSVIKHISEIIGVMYLGKIVEFADDEELFSHPLHPYTQALISAIPVPDPDARRRRIVLQGDVPSPINPPPGCHFHTRCPQTMNICKEREPVLTDVGGGHEVACHLYVKP